MTSGDDASAQSVTEPAPPEPVVAVPKITAERFVRTVKDRTLGAAFVHVEKLREDGVRRLTQSEWESEYDAFLKAPRG